MVPNASLKYSNGKISREDRGKDKWDAAPSVQGGGSVRLVRHFFLLSQAKRRKRRKSFTV